MVQFLSILGQVLTLEVSIVMNRVWYKGVCLEPTQPRISLLHII